MSTRGTLVRRALAEHRLVVVPLAIILLANLLVYAFVVYPLERRVSTVTERTRAAETELAAARALQQRAAATLTGKDEAARELDQFYGEVLPANLPDARALVHPRLDELARQADLRPLNTSTDLETDPDSTLTRLSIQTRIAGSYAGIRRFIHQLEEAPEFLVIDGIALAQNTTDEGQLTVEMELSTYYTEMAP